MAEYVKNIAEKDPWDRWEKMHARNNVGFDRIISKLEILLQHYNCSPSSSHGASNSPKYIPTSEPEPLNINLLMHDELRSPAKQVEVPSVHEQLLMEEEIVAFAKQIEDPSVPAKPILESPEPYFDNLVTDSTKLVDDLGELAFDNVQRIGEFRREDGFEVQCDTNLTVHNSGIIATPELSKAEPITTHSVHNDDTSRLDESQRKVTDNDVAGNRGLSLQSEIPFALYLTSIVNNHASSMEPKFQLHWDDLLTKHKVVLVSIYGNLAVDITGIQYDSRLIPPDAQSSLLNFGHHVFAEMCEQGVLSWTGLILGSVARINGWNGKQVQSDRTSLASFTEWYETPLPKPPVSALLSPLLSLEPPNGVAVENRLMFPPPPKPPGHGFQLQVTRATAVLPPPPEPPDVEHIVVVLQGFATLIFPCLTGLRSLYRNGYRVTDSILESLSILSQLVILHNFDSKFYTLVSILIMKLVHARTQQWNFLKVSNQYSGKGNVNLDEMYASYENRGLLAVVNYTLHDLLAFHAYGADINQNKEMCVEALQHLKSFCPFVDNLKLDITCINAIASCFSRFEYSNSESWHLGREAKVDVGWWIKYLSVLRIDNFQIVITIENSTFFVFYLSDIHFSNYHVCHDVELVSTVAFSHAKGSLQISNESLDTKMRHQATQLCGNTIQLIEKLHATLNTAVLLHNCGVCDMSKMILDCSNFLIVGYIKTGVLDRKVLLSLELVSKCWMVVAMQVDYGDFDLMRLNCGCVYCVLRLKKRDITSYSSLAVLSQFSLIHYCFRNAHLSIWLPKFNIQGNIADSYGLCFLLLVTYATVGIWKDAKQLWLGGAAMKCVFEGDYWKFAQPLYYVELNTRNGPQLAYKKNQNTQNILATKSNFGKISHCLSDKTYADVQMFPLSWGGAFEFSHVIVTSMDSLEDDILDGDLNAICININFLTEVVTTSIWTICNQFLISCAHFKQWDPGQHLEMCTTIWSFKFKQWDPGKIGAMSNFYNLEDKVDFKGEGIVMNLLNWIGPK
ncbi:uncharacterized protein LOC123913321 isoform X1 [Trifolium pratense]|uniref:Uncharacterized protein n=1 Tax=Trifolium pratense TaxID=57577 RepID=A0ACB0K7Y9_TRIPR|nr:uncharacterized protein LOC123913321 isoform X1 [Trifolium pratense]CAJ2651812.1 unnamed protein product [Trifolium pratense]